MQDGTDRQGRGHRNHQRIGEHDDCAGLTGHGVVALFKHLGHGEDLQAQQGFGQKQVQGDDAQAQRGAQPKAGDAVNVTQLYRTDGRGTAQYCGGHGAHV
ncbi:hypothetical protein D3C72_1841740 [compost metagenome]